VVSHGGLHIGAVGIALHGRGLDFLLLGRVRVLGLGTLDFGAGLGSLHLEVSFGLAELSLSLRGHELLLRCLPGLLDLGALVVVLRAFSPGLATLEGELRRLEVKLWSIGLDLGSLELVGKLRAVGRKRGRLRLELELRALGLQVSLRTVDINFSVGSVHIVLHLGLVVRPGSILVFLSLLLNFEINAVRVGRRVIAAVTVAIVVVVATVAGAVAGAVTVVVVVVTVTVAIVLVVVRTNAVVVVVIIGSIAVVVIVRCIAVVVVTISMFIVVVTVATESAADVAEFAGEPVTISAELGTNSFEFSGIATVAARTVALIIIVSVGTMVVFVIIVPAVPVIIVAFVAVFRSVLALGPTAIAVVLVAFSSVALDAAKVEASAVA